MTPVLDGFRLGEISGSDAENRLGTAFEKLQFPVKILLGKPGFGNAASDKRIELVLSLLKD